MAYWAPLLKYTISRFDEKYSFNTTTQRGGSASHPTAHIVIVENRDLEAEKTYGYYTFAMWKLYSDMHPDCNVLAYNSSSLCAKGRGGNDVRRSPACKGYNGILVAPYWMKVLAVLHAMDEANEDDLIVFVDNDSQILNANFTRSIFDLGEIKSFLRSGKSMLVIDERKDSWWSHVIIKRGGIYKAPIVSNLFAVINNRAGRRIIDMWWRSMAHPTKWDPSGLKMHWEWPWEQERLAALYDNASDLFYPVNQSWAYFGWLHHGPLCCIGFQAKHDIIRSLNETLTNQTRSLPMYNGSYSETVYDLFHQLQMRNLSERESRAVIPS